ncbi:Outer-arm_dynein gamma [Hexamita inflata]|uniref:Outer-arm dynein gamma n=1 Tax=Hexamita inflata TaxID=28002 RepID=A0AA86U5R9_9EUKA|nr:Outer-arm dynein gamma [Hexamita inflata]
MVPDREIIIRVKLASAGFEKATELAKKFFQLYKLCTEQLSRQTHYDFGLRNILSVLRTCGYQLRDAQAAGGKQSESDILMRVLIDMNRSKLVDEDIPLFQSLTKDLFPTANIVPIEYPGLKPTIRMMTEKLGILWNNPKDLQRENSWHISVEQFYETHNVRHGIMILGPTMAGKSATIYTLAKVMAEMNPDKKKYTVLKMNPKAITAPQMFGILNSATGDWTDGIFSALWRKCCKKEGEFFWISLNGPVDAVWIENLNTVLDDNKTLTLANSDRIPMSKTLKLIFEVDSLENASPATVSRAGMIYMSGFSAYGWRLMFTAWIKDWPKDIQDILLSTLDNSGLVDELYRLLDIKFRPVFNSPMLGVMRQFLQLLTSMIYDGCGMGSQLDNVANKELLTEAIQQGTCFANEGFCNNQQAQNQFIATCAGQLVGGMPKDKFKKCIFFCLMWSFGAILDLDDRRNLQKVLYEDPIAKAATLAIPTLKNTQDFMFNYFVNDQGNWQEWAQVVPSYTYPADRDPPFSSILIPTMDNTCINYLLTKLERAQFNTLLTGEAGSGKTQNIFTYLASKNSADREDYAINNINFSSATTMGILQNNIESFVDKRQGFIYGPPNGKKGIVFIDEVNIPRINEWNDQPTNELTRQLIEERGLYALNKPGEFHQLQDLTFIAAMPLPGGGRNDIPARLKSHFCIFNVNLPAPDQLDLIFSTIIKGHYQASRGFSDEIGSVAEKLVVSTRRLWTATKIKMLPTPAKFHYIFNLRDMSRITQGFINSSKDEITSVQQLCQLWTNECYRVLPDKFTNIEDIAWFDNQVIQIAKEELGEGLGNEVMNFVNQGGENKYMYFCDFMRDAPDEIPDGVDLQDIIPKIYEPIYDKNNVQERIFSYQKKYNDDPINKTLAKLDLVLFDSCIQHILRISRIIRTPKAHALLVGVGGSGKQSCARIASYIAGYKVDGLKIERNYGIPQLDEDLKRIYRLAGQTGRGVSFIFTDNDIKDEIFLERINNILTMGELPSLFNKEEKEEITQLVRTPFKKQFPKGADTNDILWNYFIQRAKNNLHVILCFSPVGEKFRTRARKFPGLISGCTIDWFLPWTRKALEEVADKMFKSDAKFQVKTNNDQTIPNLVQHFANVHSMMTDVTQKYFEVFRKQTYVTPKSYLSFLDTFKKLYLQKYADLRQAFDRLKQGLDKLEKAASDVAEMRIQLEKEEKLLQVAQVEVNAKMAEIEIKKKEAGKIKAEVQKVVDECSEKARVVKYNTDIAEEGKKKAEPEKIAAEEALNSIEQSAIIQLVKLDNPPVIIQRVFDCVMILLNEKIDKVSLDTAAIEAGKACPNAIKPSWLASSTQGKRPGFFNRLIQFEKDAVTDEQCELIRAYIEKQVDMRDKTAAERAFKQVVGLHSWNTCLVKYHYIMNDFIPIQNKVIELNKTLAIANAAKDKAESDLAIKQAALDALQKEFDIADGNRRALQEKADKTAARLNAAASLIKGLSGERKRWGEQLKEIDQSILNLVGDVSLAAAFLSYCGPFNQQYRDLLIHSVWMKDIMDKKLPHTKNIDTTIIQFLTNEAQIGSWRLKGLPTDDQSTQNALIVTASTRYPLLIDPQGQAGIWIKQMYPEAKVISQNNKMFRQIMEDCLESGIPVLIEDVEEELDPVLDPVLEKNYSKSGRGLQINFGNKNVSFDKNFNLFITTKLPRPRYSPETYAKTSIIDFTVTFGGLEAQLLARTVSIERKELEEQRKKLLKEVNDNKRKALDLEESLLQRLSATQGNLLDDDELVIVLQETKKTTDFVNQQLAIAQETEANINQMRENYLPVATRGSNIYFLITDMQLVNNMYQTSLKQFLELFDASIYEAPQSPIAQKRIDAIKEYMTLKIYKFISRGLYEKDKQLFTLNLCLKIDMKDSKISQQEFMIFVRAGAALDSVSKPKPTSYGQMSDSTWYNICALSAIPTFTQLPNQIAEDEAQWKPFYDHDSPESLAIPQYDILNNKETKKENRFKRLLLIRCLREDRAMLACNEYINDCLGESFTDAYTSNYDDILVTETNPSIPICFLLSLGSDPTGQLEVIAKKRKIELKPISMGQGQEVQARRLITESLAHGGWVVINNSHLSIKFMNEVENMINDIKERYSRVQGSEGKEEEQVDKKKKPAKEEKKEEEKKEEKKEEDPANPDGEKKNDEAQRKANEAEAQQTAMMGTSGIFSLLTPKQGPHADFRLVLTTEPHQNFPIGLLQKCIKLTNDLPSGMRAGLKRTYTQLTQDTLDSVDKPQYWLPLMYAIAYIHSTIIERKKYGPLGWCIKYEFGTHDFNASIQFLQSYLYALDPRKAPIASQISYPTIRYMISEVHYGGRITDDFDRRLMNTYAQEWISPQVVNPNFYFSQQAKYTHPYNENLQQLSQAPTQNPQLFSIGMVREYINKLPAIDTPQIYRMHANAEINFRLNETANILNTLLGMQPKEGGGAKGGLTREETALQKAKAMQSKLPEDYQMKTTVKQILLRMDPSNDKDAKERKPRPPLNVFLEQELQRIQKVLSTVKSTLKDLEQAIAGTIIMSEHLQDTLDAIYDARVPKKWLAISWELNSLGSWQADLIRRCAQFTEWLKQEKTGELNAFWLTGFFNPTGFLTAVKQKITRTQPGWSLDKVTIITTVQKQDVSSLDEIKNINQSKKGVYIYGMFLEGASWNKGKDMLQDALPKQLYAQLPLLLVDAQDMNADVIPVKNALKKYDCPVYKTPFRTGLNFIFSVLLNTDKDPNEWTLKGTALLCQKE